MDDLRLFIAVDLSEAVRTELHELQAKLKGRRETAIKWVNPAGIHITLKFLGYVAPDKVKDIIEAMDLSAEGIAPFQLTIRGLGGFPNLNRMQVAWAGLSGDTGKLITLAKRLEINFEILGFPRENRAFTPHLTLARLGNASPEDRQNLGKLLASTEFDSKVVINVEKLSLMRSQLTRAGAVYTRLEAVKLT